MSERARILGLIAVIQAVGLAVVLLLPGSPISLGLALLGAVASVVLAARCGRAEGAALDTLRAEMTALRKERDRLSLLADVVKESSERYREYSEAAADWFWESDADQRFTFFSSSFETVMNITSDDLLGKRSWDIVSERMEIDSDQWQAHIADLTAQRPFRDFKYWLEDGAGRARWIKVNGLPRFDEDGVFIGYRGTGSDITAAVENAHRMHMLNRAVEQSPVSIVITDLNADIQYVNSAFLRVTGYSMDEVIGHNPRFLKSDLTPPAVFEAMWAALTVGDKWEGELVNRRKTGELYWEMASIQPISNIEGNVTNYLAIKSDITEQKSAAAKLAELVEELRRSNEELEQFAYVASHDLRQPLRMISAYLGLLERKLSASFDQDARDFFGFAVDGARRLDRMIVDLLEYSRIGRITTPMAPVPLGEAVSNALRYLEVAIAESKAQVLVPDILPTISGDGGELVRLFQNLIGNALKYMPEGRRPRIEVFCRDGDGEWVVGVKDNGIGIAADDLKRVFGIFQRLVAREQYEGTGIGLAVCRKIAEHHGGRIWVESECGLGSTFLIAFPKV
ncbi:Phytochrome two-component sensor histidine kinase Cyanobacterial phytochrome B [Paramagnetospirillum magnetotacticum MS-1]|uniref:histidine kinase n=1 Tax=Paramagnetospirillum magnetotacticum MS-1 TaxID=272627 RepID=A0A0C2V2L8_PARME|nr:PAS domain-containing sensor histidine kinase [Paramagnetospirillum magnetotacticum]KIL99326.1 Phytochrome two-component sensor histidine kinase Cyanobacterial phytochrome B [Paramagnetospirillum magnetotacticum MS-1]